MKDLILSTLKPRLKNLTVEDINSSLYYFHLDLPEDSEFIEKHHVGKGRSRSTETITRKPVAPSKIDVDTLQPPPASSTDARPPSKGPPNEGSVQRHPLGPRPLQSQASVKRKPLPPLPGVENSNSQKLKLPPRPSEGSFGNHNTPSKTFSMTVIRRDPSSMAQWNIGRISSNPLTSASSPISECDLDNRYGPIYVYIDTPGFGKFRQVTDYTGATNGQVQVTAGFSRKVSMAWESSPNWRGRGSLDQQRASANSKVDETFTEDATQAGSGKSGREKGYVFLSPWNGQCSFTTTLGGRALKCRHTLSGNGMRIDPTDPTSRCSAEVSELRFNLPNIPVLSSHKGGSKSVDLSRFASKFSHMRNKLSSDSGTSSRSVPISPNIPAMKLTRSTATSDDDDNDDGDVLDHLGREKAGGGNRGKRVKLGKLIIYHEGTQMLDLIVAANMGVFWRSWDRSAS